MVQYEGDSYQLTTGFQDSTITYFETQSFQERIIQAVKLGPSYAEVSRKTLSVLIEVESFVHKQAFMNSPGDWNPDKFIMRPPETSSAPQSTASPFQDPSEWPREKHHPADITEIRLAPIGVAHTPYVNQDVQNQPSPRLQFGNEEENEDESHRLQFSIELHSQFISALKDLAKFKYIYVISYLNQAETDTTTQIVSPWDSTQTRRGLFATRIPNRPNPIGISVVRLLQVDKKIILVYHRIDPDYPQYWISSPTLSLSILGMQIMAGLVIPTIYYYIVWESSTLMLTLWLKIHKTIYTRQQTS